MIDFGEQCDNGATNSNGSDCTVGCKINVCGDGKQDTGGANKEECDLGSNNGMTSACSEQCTTQSCGNGILELGEQCDLGTANSDGSDCTSGCTINVCGDGKQDTGGKTTEQCDDGAANGVGSDTCSKECTTKSCGNGILDFGEDCDLGGANADDNDCTSGCKINVCGDHHKDTVGKTKEQCDDGSNNGVGSDTCSAVCTLPNCGDGILEEGEDCDNGANNGSDEDCLADCSVNTCGDGNVDTAGQHVEGCDDGSANGVHGDCLADCTPNVCGDGHLDTAADSTEDCDDGSANGHESCDYNTSCFVCSATCQKVTGTGPKCGDGAVDPEEACDDGSANGCGACAADCKAVTDAKATGFIVVVPGSDLVGDGTETFTLSDGTDTETFEYDLSGGSGGSGSGGNISIVFASNNTLDEIRNVTKAAILSTSLNIDVTVDGVVLDLENNQPTSAGNVAISTTISDADFTVGGMDGGAGGTCVADTKCKIADDCASGLCSSGHMPSDPPVIRR